MHKTIKSISLSSLRGSKAIQFFHNNNLKYVGLKACVKIVCAHQENSCSVLSSIYNNHWQLPESIGNKDGRKLYLLTHM
jgi:hypothetical protein